jgi:sugar phosphate isomerase/epimerase
MKLGFLVRGPFSFEESVNLASEGPFDCLEVHPSREWLGDTDEAHKAREGVKKLLEEHDVFIASIMAPLPSLGTPAEEMDGHLKNGGCYGSLQ